MGKLCTCNDLLIFLEDKENKASLQILQRSICVICIDNKLPESAAGEEDSTAAKMMLHGGGSEYNSANRWCDKTLQVELSSGSLSLSFTLPSWITCAGCICIEKSFLFCFCSL